MKNSKRFTRRVSKKHVHQISSYRTYESKFPAGVYAIIAIIVVAAIVGAIAYGCTLK